MSPGLRFQSAEDNHRPFGCHRYVVWSPKIRRRLTLFGDAALNAWIGIESNPQIVAFCERPVVSRNQKPARVVDFWVQMSNVEELWFLRRRREPQEDPGSSIGPSFRSWAQENGLTLRYFEPAELLLAEPLARNWGVLLRYLTANRSLITEDLLERVRDVCMSAMPLRALEQHLGAEDPVLVRTAAFHLLQQGHLRSRDFGDAPVGPTTRFEAVDTA